MKPPSSATPLFQAAGPQAWGIGQDIYDAAYLAFSRASSLAIAGFGELLRRLPDSPLAGNACYWMGEAHWGLARWHERRGEPQRAADARRQAIADLATVVERYPRGEKKPAAMYRQALILIELGETEQARLRLEQLVAEFPRAAESGLAREELSRQAE